MPETRQQQSEARKLREADLLLDFDNMHVLLGNSYIGRNINESDSAIGDFIESKQKTMHCGNSIAKSASNNDEIRSFIGNGREVENMSVVIRTF